MFESAICQIIFYVFAILAIACAVGVIAFRNPVASAMNMALCFGFTAAVLFGMGAQFMGIVQLIVYAGAILVLFLFVVMMLDVKEEERFCKLPLFIGLMVASVFAGMVVYVSINLPGVQDITCPFARLCDNIGALAVTDTPAATACVQAPSALGGYLPELNSTAANLAANPGMTPESAAAATGYPDVKLLGKTLFTQYNIAFVILSFALLAGTVGAVALARKIRKD